MNAHKYRIILQREFYSKKHLCVSFVLYCLIDPQSYCDKKMNTLIYGIYMEGINMFVDESYLEKLIIDDDYFDLVLYNHEMELTRQLIEICSKAIYRKSRFDFTYEEVCYRFAKSIISYAEIAYNNMVLGHFNAFGMIERVLIENIVCMDIIVNHEKEELWKYYLIQSFNDYEKYGKNIIKEFCKLTKIDKEFFYKPKNKRKKFIDIKYGWTYKINRDFTFRGLCNLVDKNEYKYYKWHSIYSHGTSFPLKLEFIDVKGKIMQMVIAIYSILTHLVDLACLDVINDEYVQVLEEMENILMNEK